MRAASALLALSLLAAAPAAAQSHAPAPAPAGPANPWRDLFTRWDGANRDSLAAESETAPPQEARPEGNAVPAFSPLAPPPLRSEDEAVALGRRVGEMVRAGDCAGGERMAREAGDLALVRAVREHCRQPR